MDNRGYLKSQRWTPDGLTIDNLWNSERNIIVKTNKPEGILLYQRIRNQVINEISMGKFKVGDLIPTEIELMNRFNASRTTVRHAMSELVEKGILVRKRGKGTFVSKNAKTKPRIKLNGSFEDILDVGRTTVVNVVRFEYIEAPRQVADLLEIPEKETILQIDRVRFSGKEPFIYSINYLPDSIGRYINKDILLKMPLLDIVIKQCTLPIVSGIQKFSATMADQDVAKLLNINVGVPLLEIERIVKTTNDKPLYLFLGFFRSDIYNFETEFSFPSKLGSK